jgi:N6-adenosine-specific RNA methylase IME4
MNLHLQPSLFGLQDDDASDVDAIDWNEPDDTPWTGNEFAHLPMFGFDLLMYDPPWHYSTYSAKGQDKGAVKHYRTWTLRKIKSLPIGTIAARDSVLMLWGTSPMLLDAKRPSYSPMGDVLEALGFRYGAFGGWAKRTRYEKLRVGTGYVMRSVMEPFLIGTTGSPEHSKACVNLINGLAREHSRKPEAAYRWCERYMPDARRIEICNRTERPGWEAWGDEVGKFNQQTGP